jgi:hypothetical protein
MDELLVAPPDEAPPDAPPEDESLVAPPLEELPVAPPEEAPPEEVPPAAEPHEAPLAQVSEVLQAASVRADTREIAETTETLILLVMWVLAVEERVR